MLRMPLGSNSIRQASPPSLGVAPSADEIRTINHAETLNREIAVTR